MFAVNIAIPTIPVKIQKTAKSRAPKDFGVLSPYLRILMITITIMIYSKNNILAIIIMMITTTTIIIIIVIMIIIIIIISMIIVDKIISNGNTQDENTEIL